MIIIIFLSLILIILVYNYYVHHGKNGRLINLIPGPEGYPITGNVLQYICSRGKLKFNSIMYLYRLLIIVKIKIAYIFA